MGLKSNIEDSTFSNFTSIGKGGVIRDVSNNPFFILLCSFIRISTDDVGGVIYKLNSDLYLDKNYFYRCRTTHKENNNGGNIIHCKDCNFNCSFFAASESWINAECGDSCVATYTCGITLKLSNASDCTQLDIYSSIFLEASKSKSEYISYVGCYGGSSHRCHFLGCNDKDFTSYHHLNFISTKVKCLVSTSISLTITECYIFGNSISQGLVPDTITISNSYGDVSTPGIKKISSTQTYISVFTFRKKCHAKLSCFHKRTLSHSFHNIIVLCFYSY